MDKWLTRLDGNYTEKEQVDDLKSFFASYDMDLESDDQQDDSQDDEQPHS